MSANRRGNLDIQRKITFALKMRVTLPKQVGAVAVNFFKDGFRQGGFTDRSFKPWALPKRQIKNANGRYLHSGCAHWDLKGNHTGFTAADRKRAILVKSGKLRRSIQVTTAAWPTVKVGSPIKYAAVHNFGLQAGSANARFTMPKREFIGESHMLAQTVNEMVKKAVLAILNA